MGSLTGLVTLLAFLWVGQATAAVALSPVIRWTPDPAAARKIVVEVTGLGPDELKTIQQAERKPADWGRAWFSVYADQGDAASGLVMPAMLGTYSLHTNTLRFTPQFPLEPGVNYRAIFRLEGTEVGSFFSLPPRNLTPTAAVTHVYPSADLLPENLLKFYIHFSAPMSGGHSYDFIHLLHENGSEVELPFLRLGEELWNPAMTRLTLLIDPGRIKRGVQPNEQIGPSITEGQRFALLIDSAWKDAANAPLKESFRKLFMVGPPDRKPLNVALWKIQPPKSGTREPITLLFPKPMDHALALRVISVLTKTGTRLEGTTTLEDHEQRWRFVPRAPWAPTQHNLVIETTLEDLAGNNIGKAFDVEASEHLAREVTSPTVTLKFEPLP